MEGMLKLDQLSGLADQDRSTRKDTIRGIQGMLDEIDNAKLRVAKLEKHLKSEIDKMKPEKVVMTRDEDLKAEGKSSSPAKRGATEQNGRANLAVPNIDWTRVRLPVKFSLATKPSSYCLSASVPGLAADSLRLRHDGENVLTIEGLRTPSSSDRKYLDKMLAEHIQRLPASERARLRQTDVDEMMVKFSHGRFGLFSEDFEIPPGVSVQDIESTYQHGVLVVTFPRKDVPSQRETYPAWNHFAPMGRARTNAEFGRMQPPFPEMQRTRSAFNGGYPMPTNYMW
jgi:HSP20 family molecular chaperone IbpA